MTPECCRFALLTLVATLGAVTALPVLSEGELEDPRRLLEAAFANQYQVDQTSTIELVIRSTAGQERHRRFEAASKIIDDRMHSIGRLTYPEHLRGMTILQIEADDRSHDAFIYLPSMQAVRRVSTAQRGDAFFGTDVTYEDLERRDVADYEVVDWAAREIDGEPGVVIRARPRGPRSYFEVLFSVALTDYAILGARYFKRDAREPYRTIEATRSSMLTAHGHTLPTKLVVRDLARGGTTEVRYRDLTIGAEIDDRVFSIRTLETRRRIRR